MGNGVTEDEAIERFINKGGSMSNPLQPQTEITYQSVGLQQSERRTKSIVRSLKIFAWGLLAFGLAMIVMSFVASGESIADELMDTVKMTAIFGGLAFGCFGTVAAVRRRRPRTVGVAAIVAWIIAGGFGALVTFGCTMEALNGGPERLILLAVIVGVCLPIVLGCGAIAWGLTQIARMLAKENREHAATAN
jgi:hypothetical protein